jgi:hypothetical protein
MGVALVAAATAFGCGSGGSTAVGPSSVGDDGGARGGGVTGTGDGGVAGGGGGGGVAGGGGSGGGGGGGSGGGDGGGSGGGGGGGSGGGGSAACTLTGPTALVSDIHAPKALALDATDAYYIDGAIGHAALYRVPKSGGTPAAIADVLQSVEAGGTAWDVVVDVTTIYLMQGGKPDMAPEPGAIDVIDKRTGAKRRVAGVYTDCAVPLMIHVATAGGVLYWVQHNAVNTAPGCSAFVQRNFVVALDPGSDTPRVVREITDGGNALAVDAFHLFWNDASATWRLPTSGGTPEQLASFGGDALVTDGSTLFTFHMMTLTAITAPGQYATLYGGPQQVQGIAVDDAHVYFGSYGGVMRMAKDGSELVTIATGDSNTPAVDATQVYYFSGSNLMTACK